MTVSTPNTAKLVLIGVIAPVWALNLFAPLLVSSYQSNPSVNGIFAIVVSAIFAPDAVNRFKGGGGRDEEPKS